MRLAVVKALLRLSGGRSQQPTGHFDEDGFWVWDTEGVYTSRWRRRLLVWQWNLVTKK